MNGKRYIGYTENLTTRRGKHWWSLDNNKCENPHLQYAWKEYGKSAFIYETIEECDKEYLPSMEHYWCIMLDTHNPEHGYNIAPTHPHKRYNTTPTDEQRKKMRDAKIGSKNKFYGKHHTEETKKKLSSKFKGIPISDNHKAAISKATKGGKKSQSMRDKVKQRHENNRNTFTVTMYNIKDGKTRTFDNITEAAKYINPNDYLYGIKKLKRIYNGRQKRCKCEIVTFTEKTNII